MGTMRNTGRSASSTAFPRDAWEWENNEPHIKRFALVPKLLLGNSVGEAPASRLAKLELRIWVPKQELGNQRNTRRNASGTAFPRGMWE